MSGDWRKKECDLSHFWSNLLQSVSQFHRGSPPLTKGRLRTPRSTQVLSTRSLGLFNSLSCLDRAPSSEPTRVPAQRSRSTQFTGARVNSGRGGHSD